MNSKRIFLSSVLMWLSFTFAVAQGTNDTYRVKVGENVLRVLVSNLTQAPLSGLTLKFAEQQPSWFGNEMEITFDIGIQRGEVIELPFQINATNALNETVTLQLLSQDKLLGAFDVKVSSDGMLGKIAGQSSSASSTVEHRLSDEVEEAAIPTEYALQQNYPNPFNPSTIIQYDLPEASQIAIEIFDPLGRLVRTLVKGEKAAGVYTVTWEGTTNGGELLPSGVYIYRLTTEGYAQTRKMLLVR